MQEWCIRFKFVFKILVYGIRYALTSRKMGTTFNSGLDSSSYHYE